MRLCSDLNENSIDLCLCKWMYMYTPRIKKEQKLQKTSFHSSKWFLCTISMLIIRPGIIMSFQWLDIHVHLHKESSYAGFYKYITSMDD